MTHAYLWMPATFASGETFVLMTIVLEAVESFGGVKVQLVPTDFVVETKKVLQFVKFRPGILNQLVCSTTKKKGVFSSVFRLLSIQRAPLHFVINSRRLLTF